MIRIKRVLDDPDLNADRSFLEWPLVRVLIPPERCPDAAGLHGIAFTMCFAILSLAGAWVVAVALPFFMPTFMPTWAVVSVPVATLVVCVGVFYTGWWCYGAQELYEIWVAVVRSIVLV